MVCEFIMGSLCLSMSWKKNWLGDWPSSRAMFRHAAIAMDTFSLAQIHLDSRDVMFLYGKLMVGEALGGVHSTAVNSK